MKIETPILSKLNHSTDPRDGRTFDSAIACLNNALEQKKIWNVELNDAKFRLSSGVDRACEKIVARHRATRGSNYHYEKWQDDFSMYCGLNQAAGRIRRLVKVFGITPKNAIIDDYLAALTEVVLIWKAITMLKPFVVKGRRPNETKTEAQIAADLHNTGICAICGRRQKLEEKKMVQHGYTMSDFNHSGYRIGKCFGVGYMPYELSNEANVVYALTLWLELKHLKTGLKTLKSGTIETFVVKRDTYVGGKREKVSVVLLKGTEEFNREVESQISQAEMFIRSVKLDIRVNDAKIANWTLQPLMYGSK